MFLDRHFPASGSGRNLSTYSMIKSAVLALAFLLTACSSTGQVQSSLNSFIDKPSAVAIGVFGFPSDVQMIVKRKVYVWKATAGKDCIMRMVVDPKDIVRNVDLKGDQGQCGQFDQRAP